MPAKKAKPPEPLVEPTFLFRFSTPLYHRKEVWADGGLKLSDKHVLPSFGELNGSPIFADLRAAWNVNGLGFTLQVRGKKQAAWCRSSRPGDSDGLQLCIDTRDTHTVHRATRYSHRFCFLPFGSGRDHAEPTASLLSINRAKEQPAEVAKGVLRVRSESRIDGYLLFAHIPASALSGFDPGEHPRLGFSYAIIDRELGWQTFSLTEDYPILEDPTLWGSLELTD